MQKTIYNQQKPFVYLWRDRLLNRYYLGYHNGKKSNYICSSKYMLAEYEKRPQDFRRRILTTGGADEMGKLEQRLLRSRKDQLGERYYNLAISFPIYKRTAEVRKKMAEATRKRMANMTPEQRKQMSDRIKANHGGGPPKGHKKKIRKPINFDRKVYDRQRKITLRNQDFLLFGL